MIRALDAVLAETQERAEQRFGMREKGVNLEFRSYGKDAVMGAMEPGDGPAQAKSAS